MAKRTPVARPWAGEEPEIRTQAGIILVMETTMSPMWAGGS